MLTRTGVVLASVLTFASSQGWAADAYGAPRHHRHAYIVPEDALIVRPAAYGGGRLVMHPASNIACNTPFRSSRALPCDQPVWVYGSPCEIDLGLGRSRFCN
jgi:hypothetical protein